MMNLNRSILCIAVAICAFTSTHAQSTYSISACGKTDKPKQIVGNRFRFSLPKNAVVKKSRDVDYSAFNISFGAKRNLAWLLVIFGPNATSGNISKDWVSSSVEVKRRNWKYGEANGVDAKGKLANGNYWRYFGMVGESISYHDVSPEAAAYFDSVIDSVCYMDWR
jgi:hypothetical protein